MYEGLTTSLEGLTTRWVVIDDLLTWRLCRLEPQIFSILTKQLLIPGMASKPLITVLPTVTVHICAPTYFHRIELPYPDHWFISSNDDSRKEPRL